MEVYSQIFDCFLRIHSFIDNFVGGYLEVDSADVFRLDVRNPDSLFLRSISYAHHWNLWKEHIGVTFRDVLHDIPRLGSGRPGKASKSMFIEKFIKLMLQMFACMVTCLRSVRSLRSM